MIIRCISLWQPWASLMACAVKRFETRSWPTKIRGEIYIHAAGTLKGIQMVGAGPTWITNSMEEALGPFESWRETLPLGAIVARGELVRCVPAADALREDPGQEPFGDFTPGRFVHVYQGLRAIAPVPTRGRQGFWSCPVDDEVTLVPPSMGPTSLLDHERELLEGFLF